MKTTVRKRRQRQVDTSDYMAMVSRILQAAAVRVADSDPSHLRELLAVRAELDELITEAVGGLRDSGATWQEIGNAAGTTRQAALMRWGSKL